MSHGDGYIGFFKTFQFCFSDFAQGENKSIGLDSARQGREVQPVGRE